uniref:Putative transcription initiation factor tfiid subunit n=2 Tax=Rhodnius TaxID=13248 RepID=R4FNG6_RHOPR
MSKKEGDPPVELECQFILRLPEEPANVLKELLRSGATSLKDRFSVRLENDVRYGEVRVDNWFLHAKVVDLPTIVESLKTIDNKSFYKTADICQLMICKEEDDQTTTDDESPSKHKKKDPNKVDKKFLWPHGITPPMKNVRKRRFRKTLKKKYVEAPEVEKEVKRLLRGDNDAVSVKWEVISEEEEKKGSGNAASNSGTPSLVTVKEEPSADTSLTNTQASLDVAEHDIFGGAVSDSDEEEPHIMEMEESSRMSADDSHISDSISLQMPDTKRGDDESRETIGLVTQFSKEMFVQGVKPEPKEDPNRTNEEDGDEDEDDEEDEIPFDFTSSVYKKEEPQTQMTPDEIRARLEELQREMAELRIRRDQQELDMANIENLTLRQRFQDILDSLLQQQLDKDQEYQELTLLLQMQ